MCKSRWLTALVVILLLAPMGQLVAAEDLATPIVDTPDPVGEGEGAIPEGGEVEPTETPDAGTETARIFALTDSTFIPNTGGVDFTFSTSDGSALPSGYRMCDQYDADRCVAVGSGTQTLAGLPAGRLDFVLRSDGATQHYSADPVAVYIAASVNIPVSVVLSPFDTGSVTLNITTADGGALPDTIYAGIDWEFGTPVTNGTATFDGLAVGKHNYQINFGGTRTAYITTGADFDVSANNETTVNVVLQPQRYVTVVFDVTTSDGSVLEDGWTACFVGGKGAESICAPVVGGVATVTDVPDGYYGTYLITSDDPEERKKYQNAQGDMEVGPAESETVAVELQRRTGTGAIVVELETSDSSPVDPKMDACIFGNNDDGSVKYSLCLPHDGGDITFPNVPAGLFQLSVDYRPSGANDPSPYERVSGQGIEVAEGQTVTVSKTLVPMVYGTVEVTVQTDDGGTPPAGYTICLADCKDLTQIGTPVSFTSPAGSKTVSVRYDGKLYLKPYSTPTTQVTVTGTTTQRITITLHRFAYIPVHVSITDSGGSPVTDHLEFKMGDQYTYPYNGVTTVWVEAGTSYQYTVYGGQTYKDLSGSTNVPTGATEHSLAIRLQAYPTGTFTLNVPSTMPAPDPSKSTIPPRVSLSDGTYKSFSVPIANGTTGPITWHAGEVSYGHGYASAAGRVQCNGSFTNTEGRNVTITMDCTYTPDPVQPVGIEALIAAIIAILIEILASMGT